MTTWVAKDPSRRSRGERTEREAIPQITITVEGASAQALQVTIDGIPMANSLIGETRPINPGKHLIQAKQGERTAKQVLTISEGETLPIALRLSPAATTNAPVPLPNVEPPPAGATRPANEPFSATGKPMQTRNEHGTMQRTAGWIAAGIGGVGVDPVACRRHCDRCHDWCWCGARLR